MSARDRPQPLLFPPPSPPRSDANTTFTIQRRSIVYRIISLLPLVFIFSVLFFSFYAYFIGIVSVYLLWQKGRWFKGLCYGIIFLWLWAGCTISVGQAAWRGGGFVGTPMPSMDEESRAGLQGNEGAFTLGDETDDAEEVALLGKDTDLPKAPKNKLEARSAQNKKDREFTNGGNVDFSTALRDLENDLGGEEEEWGPTTLGKRVKYESGVQVKKSGGSRWCRKCDLPKPDRAHHCSACRRCILKMDHHCPWLGGGCVGYLNYKFFLLFLWYGGMLGIFVASTAIVELMNFVGDDPGNFELAPVSWAMVMLAGCIFGFTMGCFGLYHLYLAGKNRTTIEAMEPPAAFSTSSGPKFSTDPNPNLTRNDRKRLLKQAKKINVYDVGFPRNLGEIFGGRERWWEWGLPWGAPPGDGRKFPVDETKLEKLQRLNLEIRGEDGEVTGTTITASSSEEEGEDDSYDEDNEENWHR